MTPDPIGLEGGINLFTYAADNPIRVRDPLGLDYVDFNVSFGFPFFGGFTVGIMWDKKEISPYIGGGVVSPGLGVSLTWSPSDITPGINVVGQLAAILAFQGGYGFGKKGGLFAEVGMGGSLPTLIGGSFTGY